MASAIASSMSSAATRRLHYQAQISNASNSLNQSFSGGEQMNLNDSFSASTISINPLVTIVYSNGALSQGMLWIIVKNSSPIICLCIHASKQQIHLLSLLLEYRRKWKNIESHALLMRRKAGIRENKRVRKKMICKQYKTEQFCVVYMKRTANPHSH